MKCPKCGKELTPSKKDANYLLCFDCKKKYKIPQQKAPVEPAAPAPAEKPAETVVDDATKVVATPEIQEPVEEQKYSNIPSKEVREERESEMRKAYDDLLAVEGKKNTEETDDYDDVYEDDEKMSKAPIVILAIAIVAVACLIGYMVFMM